MRVGCVVGGGSVLRRRCRVDQRFGGSQRLRALPALTISRFLHEVPAMQALTVREASGGRWQIVTTGTRAPRIWARGAATITATARASRGTA
jgi:hypothetical protein